MEIQRVCHYVTGFLHAPIRVLDLEGNQAEVYWDISLAYPRAYLTLTKHYDELPLFLNSKTVAQVLGVSPSSAYELMHEPGFPVLRVGSRMVIPKEQFIRWVEEHTEGGERR